MKNNLISESEVSQILSMHKLLKEQTEIKNATDTTSDLVTLRKAITAGCLKGGRILTNSNQSKYVYRATSKSGKTVDFTADMNYKFGDGSKSGKWKCDEMAQMEVTAAQAAQQQASNTEDINRMKKEGGWQEANELKTTRENLDNPQMFEKKVVSGVTLYRPVISSGVSAGLTPEQIKVVKKYTDLGGKLRKDLDAEEAQTWTSKVVYPAGTLFSQDLVMFFPPSNVKGTEGSKVDSEFKKAVTNQTPTSKSDCRDTIEAYYEAWRTKQRIEQSTLLPMKEKVQACANYFEGKWGGALSKIDNYIEILRGDREGGPLSDSKWRIE
jgi:hypothetical protein